MPEQKRHEPSSADEPIRDSEIDALLVAGLDRYFTGRYEDAIHVWTRVLFLDRSHARARAYIDRARTALAERQRRSDELLAATRNHLDQGDTAAARQLLAQAVAAAGEDEHASALRLQLERLERAAPVRLPARIAPAVDDVPGWRWRPRRTAMATIAVTLMALAGAGALGLLAAQDWLSGSVATRPIVTPAPMIVPTLASGEGALIQARTLYDRGRLAEALVALDRVGDRSVVRRQADALRLEIQRLLLSTARDRARPPRSGELANR